MRLLPPRLPARAISSSPTSTKIVPGRSPRARSGAAERLWRSDRCRIAGGCRPVVRDRASRFRRVDILINNTGIWFRRPFLEIADAEWDNVLSVNLKGTFMCSQRAARMMMAKRTGCIINIASHAGLFYSRGQGVHYASSKAAIIQLTRVLAFELGPLGIRINAIAPGGINTGSFTSASRDELPASQMVVSSNPLGSRGEPEDIAQAALFLASQMAKFITGQTLVVNGGTIGSS